MVSSSLVLYHNRQGDVDKVLDSVLNSRIDIIIVVDHSINDNFKVLAAKSNKVKYFHRFNDGSGSGHNFGFKESQKIIKSDYHIVLNPDIYFESSAIDCLISFMDSHKDVGLVMPKVFYPNGDFQYLCKLLPTPYDIFLRQFASKSLKDRNDDKYAMKTANFDIEMDVPSLSGCFMFFRSECFNRINGFDTRFFMHFEDIDITRRIGEIARTVFFPGTFIVHAHEAAHKKSKKMLLIGLQSAIKYFNKWGWIIDKRRSLLNKEASLYDRE